MKKINQRLTRESHYLNKHGMTSKQIHDNQIKQETFSRKIKGVKTTRFKRPATALAGQNKMNGLYKVPYFKLSNHSIYHTPPWFNKSEIPDVSIIVPLFKSNEVIKDQIESWSLTENINVEIIYVDDHCPFNSKDTVIAYWSKKLNDVKGGIGKIIFANANNGYGGACNIGAFYARGKYLIFLNADTKVTKNWIKPLVKPLEDNQVGIVGNLQLKEGGAFDGTIDSAGSEWSWRHNCFVHIGRHIYKGEDLPKPFDYNEMPDDLKIIAERDMVTGCCFAIRSDLFKEIGGFNPNYLKAYWEDSEICMTVKEKGYKILYQPESVIYHKLCHTATGHHEYMNHNIDYFNNKWVNSGRIDNLVGQKREKPLVRSILIRRQQAHGDVLFAAAVAPALKKKYNGVKIYFTTNYADILKNNPYVEGVIHDNDQTGRLYDIFYDLDMSYEYRPHTKTLQVYADTVGVDIKDCQFFLDTEEPKDLNLPPEYVVIHSGKTTWAGRNWKLHRWQEVVNKLIERNINVVSVGTDKDNELLNTINCKGKTNINQLAYIIKNSKLVFGIDSFPMHIAQIFNKPSVVFFGSVNPDNWVISDNTLPVLANDLDCIGCHKNQPTPCFATHYCSRGDLACEELVTTDMFLSKILEKF